MAQQRLQLTDTVYLRRETVSNYDREALGDYCHAAFTVMNTAGARIGVFCGERQFYFDRDRLIKTPYFEQQ